MKIKCYNYKISSLKKVWINYQIEFEENSNLEDVKEFLRLDKEVKFSFVDAKKIRTEVKKFANTEKFVKYMLDIFWNNLENKPKKIKLKK